MLLILSGPSGVGKSRLLRLAEQAFGFRPVVPLTTRPPRSGEVAGSEYEFVTKESFREMIRHDALSVWDFTLRHYYGYRKELAERIRGGENIVIQAMARMGVRIAQAHTNVILVFLRPSSDLLLEMRLTKRSYSGDELLLRRMHWEEELEHSSLFDVVIDDADVTESEELAAALADIINRFA